MGILAPRFDRIVLYFMVPTNTPPKKGEKKKLGMLSNLLSIIHAGDGDWKHIGYKVEMPGAYEVFSVS